MESTRAISKRLFDQRGLVRARDLEAGGVSRTVLRRWVDAGQLIRIARGLYALPGREPSADEALVTVAARHERAFFCLLTALRFHRLTTQAPTEVWIGLGNKDRVPSSDWPVLRVVRYSGPGLTDGIDAHVIGGVTVRITNVARTLVDCFKFRNKIGLDVALEALRDARRDGRATVDDIWRYAGQFRQTNVIRPYLESLA